MAKEKVPFKVWNLLRTERKIIFTTPTIENIIKEGNKLYAKLKRVNSNSEFQQILNKYWEIISS